MILLIHIVWLIAFMATTGVLFAAYLFAASIKDRDALTDAATARDRKYANGAPFQEVLRCGTFSTLTFLTWTYLVYQPPALLMPLDETTVTARVLVLCWLGLTTIQWAKALHALYWRRDVLKG